MRNALAAMVILGLMAAIVPVANAGIVHVCAECGEGISGSFFETKGQFYHPEHFTCAHCGMPITDRYTTYRGNNYHNGCFKNHIARRCSLCSGVIQGQYKVDYWGNAYHLWHDDDVRRCDFCDRMITAALSEGSVNFSDGRSLCQICHVSSIKKIGPARSLVTRVSEQLRRIGMRFDAVDFRLHLVGIDTMQEIANFESHDLRGFTDYQEQKNLFGRTQRREIDIYLLYGMPRVEMIGTIAHELTHVWQFLNGRLRNDAALSEGSCNYAAYWVLKQMAPGEETDYITESMLRDEDPVYGEGFRRVKRYVEKHGLSSWLALLTDQHASLPE